MLPIKFDSGQAVSEKIIFECHGNIHVYCPGVGANQPLGSKCFHYKYSVQLPISFKCFPSMTLTIFPIQLNGRPMLTLAMLMLVLEVHCLMLHAKFQNRRPSG